MCSKFFMVLKTTEMRMMKKQFKLKWPSKRLWQELNRKLRRKLEDKKMNQSVKKKMMRREKTKKKKMLRKKLKLNKGNNRR